MCVLVYLLLYAKYFTCVLFLLYQPYKVGGIDIFFLIDKAEALGNYRVHGRSRKCLGLCDSRVHTFFSVQPLKVNRLLSL